MCNKLKSIRQLRNQFFVMRHGHSLANQQGLVVSDPRNGVAEFGLSERGKSQVRISLENDSFLDAQTHIFCSDFKRALDTAEIVQSQLDCTSPIQIEPRLRERFFGNYELGTDAIYQDVWQQDLIDSDREKNNVESVNKVMFRAASLVADLDQQFTGVNILLIAHGDILQILQTGFALKDAREHRSLPHLDTAEIRLLSLDTHRHSDYV